MHLESQKHEWCPIWLYLYCRILEQLFSWDFGSRVSHICMSFSRYMNTHLIKIHEVYEELYEKHPTWKRMWHNSDWNQTTSLSNVKSKCHDITKRITCAQWSLSHKSTTHAKVSMRWESAFKLSFLYQPLFTSAMIPQWNTIRKAVQVYHWMKTIRI